MGWGCLCGDIIIFVAKRVVMDYFEAIRLALGEDGYKKWYKRNCVYHPKDPYDYGGAMWGLDEHEDVWEGDADGEYNHELD